jgi:hypothetical protein
MSVLLATKLSYPHRFVQTCLFVGRAVGQREVGCLAVIDEGLPGEWPPEIASAVSQFQQGDLVEKPPFFYVGAAKYGIWQLTREVGDETLSDELFELDSESCPPFGMVTTESCDLTEEGSARLKHPWVSISPVYDVSGRLDPDRFEPLRKGHLSYIRIVTADALPLGTWVVDARIEIPVEKSWLVGRTPIRTTIDDASRNAIAAFLADRRNRPVLGAAVNDSLIKGVRRWVERRPQVMQGVAEVRVALSGSVSDPDGAELVVVLDGSGDADAVRETWDEKWENLRNRTDQRNIALLANSYETYDSMTARRYRETYRLALDFG